MPQFKERLELLRKQGGIWISDAAGEKMAAIDVITSDVRELIYDAAIIFIATPAYRHELFVKAIAPYLEDGQFIVFISHFGAMNFRIWMRQLKISTDITPVESTSLLYAARLAHPGKVRILAVKKSLPVAALPFSRTGDFLEKVSGIFPQMTAAESVLYTSFNNAGPVVQTALLLLNAGRVENTAGKGWNLFSDGFTPAIARVAMAIEKERASVLEHLGVTEVPVIDSLLQITKDNADNPVTAETFSRTMRNHPVYTNPEVAGPASLRDRIITEAVPFGLVPWSSIADMS